MEIERIKIMEHLAFNNQLSLEDVCAEIKSILVLPEFKFDFENETEWGSVENEGIEYNVSRPYEHKTLKEWDDSLPEDCNFGMSLAFSIEQLRKSNRESSDVAKRIGEEIANHFKTAVYYHRTWLGSGENIVRKEVFNPTNA